MVDLNFTRRTLVKLLGMLPLMSSDGTIADRFDAVQELNRIPPRDEEIPVGATVVFGVEPLDGDVTYEWTIEEGPDDDPGQLLQHDERDNNWVVTFRPAVPTNEDSAYTIKVTASENGHVVGTTEFEIGNVSAGLEWHGTEEIETQLDLVEAYAPLLHFREGERYTPTRYEHFVENAVRPGDDADDLEGTLTLLDLDEDLSRIELPITNRREARPLQDQPYPRTVYASIHEFSEAGDTFVTYEGEQYLAVTYWAFYLYDPKRTANQRRAHLHHPSDLETVTLLLDRESLEPEWIGAAQHRGGSVARWDRVVDESRLDIYPAEGAHSSYWVNTEDYAPGEDDPEAVPILIQQQHLYDDNTSSEFTRLPAADLTGADTTWVPKASDEFVPDRNEDMESYELVLLTGDEVWADFDGYLDDNDESSLRGGAIPMARDRWAAPGDWIDTELVPLDEQLNASIWPMQRPTVVGREVTVPIVVSNRGDTHHEFVVRAVAYPLVPGEDEVVVGERSVPLPAGTDVSSSLRELQAEVGVIDPDDNEEILEFTAELPEYADEWDVTVRAWVAESDVPDGDPLDAVMFEDIGDRPAIDAAVAFLNSGDGEPVAPGESLQREVHIENTGSQPHEFVVELAANDPTSTDVAAGTRGPMRLDPGEETRVTMELTVPETAPAGEYTLVAAVWDRVAAAVDEAPLDEARLEDGFEVHPDPRIESFDVTVGEEAATITVDAVNEGPAARYQSIDVSISGLLPDADIEVTESTFPDENVRVFAPGTTQQGEYGETEVELDHPLVRGYSVGWETDETNTIELTVRTDQQDGFEVHVKTVATAPSVLTADPEPGETNVDDQQGEAVYAETIPAEEPVTGDGEWPMYGYDPAHTHSTPDATGPSPPIDVRWEFDEPRWGRPVPAGDVVYVGDQRGNIYALAADSGAVLDGWPYQEPEGNTKKLAVVDDAIYAGSTDGTVFALDADGTERWRFDTGRTASSPAVIDGVVYVASYDTVFALSTADGSEQWRFEPESWTRVNRPTVHDGTVYVTGKTAYGDPDLVHALAADDGAEQWRSEAEKGVSRTFSQGRGIPTVGGGTVYFGGAESGQRYVDALDATTGDRRDDWPIEVPGDPKSILATGGTVYIGVGEVYAVAAGDGTVHDGWPVKLPATGSPTPGLALAGDTLYVGGNGSTGEGVWALDAESGDHRDGWPFSEIRGGLRSPAVADDTLYVGGKQSVYALE